MNTDDVIYFLSMLLVVLLLSYLIWDIVFDIMRMALKEELNPDEEFKRDYLVSGFVPVILTRRRKKRVTPVISDKEKKTSYTSERNNQHSGGKYGH